MRKVPVGIIVATLAAGTVGTLAAACGNALSDSETNPRLYGPPDSGVTGEAGQPAADASSPLPTTVEANAIVLVHAASFPAFRICFKDAPNDLPRPSVDLMPESNVVGVDIGTAVRLPPAEGPLGQAFVFPEFVLRQYYPVFGEGPSCNTLLTSAGMKDAAIDVGTVTADLTRGVHALVLGGCLDGVRDNTASKERCGDDWDPAKGNLKLSTISLTAYARQGETRLPVQIVQLSPTLARLAAGRALGLAFGALDGGAASMPFVEGAVPFGEAVPNPPAVLDYTKDNIGSYATTGVFVTLGGALDDAGAPVGGGDAGAPRDVVISQSLADIQKRSSSRSLPLDWFSVASSYIVLSVGDTDPRFGDGGADEDPRRALHLLAIPLAEPETKDAAPAL